MLWYVVFKTPDSGGMMVPPVLNIFIEKNLDPGRTRTCNPLIRSQMPYPLGHRADLYILIRFTEVFHSAVIAQLGER